MSSSTDPAGPSSSRTRIVYVVPRDFRAITDGGRVMTAGIASALACIGELHIVDMDRRPYAGLGFLRGETLPLPFGGSAQFYSSVDLPPENAAALQGLRWSLRRVFTRRSRARRMRRATEIAQALKADIVIADDLTGCLVVRDSRAGIRIVHTHNVESLLHQGLAEQTGHWKWRRKARQYALWECQVLPALDQVWAVSESDAAFYRNAGTKDVRVMRQAFPDDRFEASPVPGKPGVGLFFGSLWYAPNVDAARYLARLMPGLRQQLPDAVIRIVGGGAGDALKSELDVPGIELLGFVDSLRDVARDAAAVIVPLAWGGGTKIKTAEAFALGKPVLATPEGSRGLPEGHENCLVVRPLDDSFVESLVAMLRQPEEFQPMAERAQALAQRCFSQAALIGDIRQALLDAAEIGKSKPLA